MVVWWSTLGSSIKRGNQQAHRNGALLVAEFGLQEPSIPRIMQGSCLVVQKSTRHAKRIGGFTHCHRWGKEISSVFLLSPPAKNGHGECVCPFPYPYLHLLKSKTKNTPVLSVPFLLLVSLSKPTKQGIPKKDAPPT